jgi:hypothetical protein
MEEMKAYPMIMKSGTVPNATLKQLTKTLIEQGNHLIINQLYRSMKETEQVRNLASADVSLKNTEGRELSGKHKQQCTLLFWVVTPCCLVKSHIRNNTAMQ